MGALGTLGKILVYGATHSNMKVGKGLKLKDLINPQPPEPNWDSIIKSLPGSVGCTKEGIQNLIAKAHTKEQFRYIITYLKSSGASNLTKWDRAVMVHECIDKIKIIATIGMFH